MKKYILIIFILLIKLSHVAYSQDKIKYSPTREFILDYDDSTIVANILAQTPKVKIDNNLTYYWFENNKVKSNKGGFSGRLLHGEYKVLDKNKNLIKQGHFTNGVVDGTWKTWNRQGMLREVQNWKEGVKHGQWIVYNNEGKIIKSTEYKNGKLHGEMMYYENGQQVKKNYKNGVEVMVKEKKPKEKTTFKQADSVRIR